jgi:hypothetical protein
VRRQLQQQRRKSTQKRLRLVASTGGDLVWKVVALESMMPTVAMLAAEAVEVSGSLGVTKARSNRC